MIRNQMVNSLPIKKSDFCTPYAFLSVLHFHQSHPKYHPNSQHPKNLLLGVDAFVKARNGWIKYLKEKQSGLLTNQNFNSNKVAEVNNNNICNNSTTAFVINSLYENNFNNMQEVNNDNDDDWNIEEFIEPILEEAWQAADFAHSPPPPFPCFNKVAYYAYLLGFQSLPFNFTKLNMQQIRKSIIKYGLLVIGGDFFIDNHFPHYKPNNTNIFIQAHYKSQEITYRVAEIKPENYENDGSEHAIILIGVHPNKSIVYYIDPNDLRCVMQTKLNDFLSKVTGEVYYRPCGANIHYLHNKTLDEEWKKENHFDSDFWPDNTCSHVQENLSLPKRCFQTLFKPADSSSATTSPLGNSTPTMEH